MAINRGNFAELLEPGLHAIYGDTYAQYPPEFEGVFDVKTSSRHNEEDQSITGFGATVTKAEGGSVSFDVAYQGYKKTYTHITYGLGFIVTREMVEDDLYRKIIAMPQALARSVRQSVELLAANILNNGFTGDDQSDGKDLFDTSRPLVGGGTWQNKPTTAADLSVTSLEQAFIDIAGYVDDRNLKMMARPMKLIIPKEESWQAQVILGSMGMPGTANNDLNPAKNIFPGGVQVMHWLTDTNAWFIKTDVPNGLTFFWRRRPEFTRDNDFNSENGKFKTTYRCDVGSTDPRGSYGNSGST